MSSARLFRMRVQGRIAGWVGAAALVLGACSEHPRHRCAGRMSGPASSTPAIPRDVPTPRPDWRRCYRLAGGVDPDAAGLRCVAAGPAGLRRPRCPSTTPSANTDIALSSLASRVDFMDPTNSEIDDYLTRYAASLTAFDSTAASELWGTPGMIIDDNFTNVINDRESMAQGLEQSYPVYRKLGLGSVAHECLHVSDLTGAVKLVHVAMALPRHRRRATHRQHRLLPPAPRQRRLPRLRQHPDRRRPETPSTGDRARRRPHSGRPLSPARR